MLGRVGWVGVVLVRMSMSLSYWFRSASSVLLFPLSVFVLIITRHASLSGLLHTVEVTGFIVYYTNKLRHLKPTSIVVVGFFFLVSCFIILCLSWSCKERKVQHPEM